MRKIKIVLIAADIGHGHLYAAKAIMSALATEMPEAEVHLIDYLHYCNPIFDNVWDSYGNEIFDYFPTFWDFYKNSINTTSLDIKALSTQPRFEDLYREKLDTFLLMKFLEVHQPDAIVCTFWYPCKIMSYLKLECRTKAMLFAVVTGFACPLDFIWHTVDVYFVASEEVKNQMAQYGISEERIKITGTPVDSIFSREVNKNAIYENLGFRTDLPTVLLLCGGLDNDSAEKLLREVDHLPYEVQIIIVAGDDQRAKKWKLLKINNPSKLYGYVDNMHELMEVSNVIVTKAGDLISAEALVKGKPMIIVEPPDETLAPGMIHYVERRNANYLLEKGVALQIFAHKDSIYTCDIEYKLTQILMNRPKKKEMHTRIKAIAKPDAAKHIAREIATLTQLQGERNGISLLL